MMSSLTPVLFLLLVVFLLAFALVVIAALACVIYRLDRRAHGCAGATGGSWDPPDRTPCCSCPRAAPSALARAAAGAARGTR